MTAAVETQPERTALAWQRTGLGILAVAGLLGHGAVRDGEPAILVAAGVAALASLGVLGGLAPVRYRRLTRPGTPASWPLAVRAVTGTVVLVALLAVAAIVTPR